jgi:hypothetical protein
MAKSEVTRHGLLLGATLSNVSKICRENWFRVVDSAKA